MTVMYRKRMQNIAEMNYVGILSITHILDIGAGDGYWTKFASALFPSAEFFLIDGNPYLHQVLQETGNEFDISVVGAPREKGQFISFVAKTEPPNEERIIFDTATAQDVVTDVTTDRSKEEEEEERAKFKQARITTIDDVVMKRGLSSFQMLRLNLQGREYEALEGASETLKTAEFVLVEVPVHQYHPGAASFQDLTVLLARQGFRVYDILDLRYSQPRTDMDEMYQVPTLVQYDVLWAREESEVFRGVSYPPPPPPRHLQPQRLGLEQGQGQRARSKSRPSPERGEQRTPERAIAITVAKHRRGLAAPVLTSTPRTPPAPAASLSSGSAGAAGNLKRYRRRRKSE
jgi:FkbM family methyltransferase